MVIGQKIVRAGNKQVFLPSHLVTMVRPKSNTPPNLATFRVPLTFNKFDLRDYLLNAYNVETAGIRSHVVAQPLEKPDPSDPAANSGRVRRPRSIKYMIAELAKPFVWPAEPASDAAWQHPGGMKDAMKRQEKLQAMQKRVQKTGNMPLRDELPISAEDRSLKEQARRLLREGGWDNRRTADPKFEKAGGR
ncbi:hypothetical protein Micbo1qcDRAFT_134444 [Microdochium bolleyi]|uniref:Large ribosomal subunit protein uL23m n=1 Tax=Microdochium bolleyi TaxID=196109 RepID=A0A136J5F8_9PEZI|nr:hypothetical protein Micbo1qcDRAFT_134444 [Microdochium bolleyi]